MAFVVSLKGGGRGVKSAQLVWSGLCTRANIIWDRVRSHKRPDGSPGGPLLPGVCSLAPAYISRGAPASSVRVRRRRAQSALQHNHDVCRSFFASLSPSLLSERGRRQPWYVSTNICKVKPLTSVVGCPGTLPLAQQKVPQNQCVLRLFGCRGFLFTTCLQSFPS